MDPEIEETLVVEEDAEGENEQQSAKALFIILTSLDSLQQRFIHDQDSP